ncbi:hypothetical protein PI126_g3943 [Phytophthora idaei]|nr:hypothetical protein PI126_g3943 [Phytophthora idaei]
MTPPVLYERIVPHLRKKWWQIARGRGLEEGDRIYRPGFKNKGKLAKRDDDFFLFVNDILTPEQVWMPHELSSEDEPNEVPGHLRENLAQEANEIIAHGHTESQHKRKRNVAKTIKSGGKNKAAHNDGRVLFVLKTREKTDTDDG